MDIPDRYTMVEDTGVNDFLSKVFGSFYNGDI
jgi:hypothetical protein